MKIIQYKTKSFVEIPGVFAHVSLGFLNRKMKKIMRNLYTLQKNVYRIRRRIEMLGG